MLYGNILKTYMYSFYIELSVCWVIVHAFLSSYTTFKDTNKVSYSLDPDQAQYFDLNPNCLQRLTADSKSSNKRGKSLVGHRLQFPFKPCRQKTCLRGSRHSETQTCLLSYRD